jgi:hypothetical protein
MREADWNGSPDGLSTRQSSTGGTLMTDSNANTVSVKSKQCSSCKQDLSRDSFSKRAGSKDGLNGRCKQCIAAYKKEYQKRNGTKLKAYWKERRLKNPDKHKEYCKEYYLRTKESRREHKQAYRDANKDKIAVQNKKHYELNKEARQAYSRARHQVHKDQANRNRRQWDKDNPEAARAQGKKKHQRRFGVDVNYTISVRLRSRLSTALSSNYKTGSAVRDLGMTVSAFKKHLGNLFHSGMTWDNWGKVWHLDHIYPLAAANLENRMEFLAVNNWRNLQPLTIQENLDKADKVTPEAQELFDSLKEEFSEHLATQKERITCNQH